MDDKKETYVRRMRNLLNQWDTELNQWQTGADSRDLTEDLRAKHQEISNYIDEIEAASDWGATRAEAADKMAEEMSAAMGLAKQKMSQGQGNPHT